MHLCDIARARMDVRFVGNPVEKKNQPLARLAQNEERGCTGREARSRGGLGAGAMAMKRRDNSWHAQLI
jgi:hypothetical protein